MSRPEWMDRGRCVIYGPHWDQELVILEQLHYCARCPVRTECLEYGLAHETVGMASGKWEGPVYGGLTTGQRIKLLRARHNGQQVAA